MSDERKEEKLLLSEQLKAEVIAYLKEKGVGGPDGAISHKIFSGQPLFPAPKKGLSSLLSSGFFSNSDQTKGVRRAKELYQQITRWEANLETKTKEGTLRTSERKNYEMACFISEHVDSGKLGSSVKLRDQILRRIHGFAGGSERGYNGEEAAIILGGTPPHQLALGGLKHRAEISEKPISDVVPPSSLGRLN